MGSTCSNYSLSNRESKRVLCDAGDDLPELENTIGTGTDLHHGMTNRDVQQQGQLSEGRAET